MAELNFVAASGGGGLDTAYAHCAAIVKAKDNDRWLASLFAPKARRRHLIALTAFNCEIARVRDMVSDPLPGEMRLQWWRDAIDGAARGQVRQHPVVAAVLDTIEAARLPREPFLALIDARVFDLYDDPMPSMGYLDGYCGETCSALIRLAALALCDKGDPGGAEAAGHAGVAFAVTGLLRALPWHAARGQVYLPTEMLARHGLVRDDIARARGGPGLDAALADMRAHARAALSRVRAGINAVPCEAAAAFLPLAFVEGYLAAMEAPGYDPFRTVIDLPRWRKLIMLWRQARRAGAI